MALGPNPLAPLYLGARVNEVLHHPLETMHFHVQLGAGRPPLKAETL